MKEEFEKWLESANLVRMDAANLTCSNYTSMCKMINGTQENKSIKHKLYVLTNLPIFKLSAEEVIQYDRLKFSRVEYLQIENAAMRLIDSWKKDGSLPTNDEVYNFNTRKSKSQKEYAEAISKKFALALVASKSQNLEASKNDTFSTSTNLTQSKKFESMVSPFVIKGTVTLFDAWLDLDNSQIRQLLLENKEDIRKLSNLLTFLSNDDPKNARLKAIQRQESFSNS